MGDEAHTDGVPMREYIEGIIGDLKQSLRDQIGELRTDIKHMQANYVTRIEHNTIVSVLRNDLDRVDREHGEDIKDLKETMRSEQQRSLVVAGIGVSIVFGIIQALVVFI